MTTEALHHQPLMPHLLIEGLNRYNDEPCLYLGDKVASYRDVRESTSQLVQALQHRGVASTGNDGCIVPFARPGAVVWKLHCQSLQYVCQPPGSHLRATATTMGLCSWIQRPVKYIPGFVAGHLWEIFKSPHKFAIDAVFPVPHPATGGAENALVRCGPTVAQGNQ